MDWAVVVAVLGGVAGLIALGLQVWSMAVAGPRVKVFATNAMSTSTGQWFVSIDVVNVGRLPVTVQGVGVEFYAPRQGKRSGGLLFRQSSHEPLSIPLGMTPGIGSGPSLPFRLADGDSQTWLMSPDAILLALQERGASRLVAVYANLATGKRVVSSSRHRRDVTAILNVNGLR